MISKNEIKQVKALAQKKFRDENGLFTVEGEKMVAEALASGLEVVKVFRAAEIGEEAMSRISNLSSPSPALAVVRIPQAAEDFVPAEDELVLALDSLRDPGNVGTIIRLADWFGIRTVIASRDTVDIYNPKVVQATMGAIFRVRFIYCDLPQRLAQYRKAGIPVYGTFLEGDNIYRTQLSRGGVIVMGSESFGISDAVRDTVSQKLFIPPYPETGTGSESLNVAVATAITCSEFRRRAL